MIKLGHPREYTKDILEINNGIVVTGLNHYLPIIFNDAESDWMHDKIVQKGHRRRPDYHNPKRKIVVEFDGLPHYQNPDIVKRDMESYQYYKDMGYSLIRIPYFMPLTASFIDYIRNSYDDSANMNYELLHSPQESMFDPKLRNTPAYMCPAGISRCRQELIKYDRLDIELKCMKSMDDYLSGRKILYFLI